MSIVVAGHTGLVGSAIYELLNSMGEDVLGLNSKVVDLLDRPKTIEFLSDVKPTVVIDAAAIVGGIGANNSRSVDFLSKNLQIQTNLIDASHQANVERFVFLGSSCIYPRECPQPMKEEYLMTGPLEATNSAYAIAKIAGIEMIKSYRKQFDHKWISVMPTNMYGPNDNFSKDQGHVLPALINRFVNAVESDAESLTLWGSGSPMREFLHSKDLAEAVVFLLERYDDDLHINVGSGQDLQISELATLIGKEVGFKGAIEWDRSRPDGTPRKLLDCSRIRNLGWGPRISLEDGIRETIKWFKENKSRVRS